MSFSKLGTAAAVAATAGALVIGGGALANAAGGTTGQTAGPDAGRAAPAGYGYGHGDGGTGARPGGRSADMPVTGDELTKVTAVVTAKDSAVKVTRVQKDPDGSYDVFATKAGAPVMFEVSADLKTITRNSAGRGDGGGRDGGKGAGHGGTHTPVTGDELTKVTAVVTAKGSAVKVTRVQKDPDGSYDVFATKAGAQVRFEVSADLKTVTQGAADAGHAGRPDGGPGPGARSGAPTSSGAASVTDGFTT